MSKAAEPPIEIVADLPPRQPPAAAAAAFVDEMGRALEAYGRDTALSAYVANIAAFKLCHALGEPRLAKPFRALMEAVTDLKEGKPVPPLLRPGPPADGNPKTRAEWGVIVSVCAFLHVLIKETKMQCDPAAKAVGEVLRKKGIKLGQDDTPTWKAAKSARNRLLQGECPKMQADSFKEEVEELTENLRMIPHGRRRQDLLWALEQFLSHGGIHTETKYEKSR